MEESAIRFDVSIADPKERLEAYVDRWRNAEHYRVSDADRYSSITSVLMSGMQRASTRY